MIQIHGSLLSCPCSRHFWILFRTYSPLVRWTLGYRLPERQQKALINLSVTSGWIDAACTDLCS